MQIDNPEGAGNPVRRLSTIAEESLATCLDAPLPFAAAVEASGHHSVVPMFDGRAAVWVWPDQRTLAKAIETHQMHSAPSQPIG